MRKLFIALIFLLAFDGANARFPHGSSAPTIPLQANLVTHFDAATTGFANGQTVTSWVDTVNSIAASGTVGTRPTLLTNQINGLPMVQCGGAGGLSIPTPGALKTAIDSGVYTVFIVFRTTGSASNGNLFSATAGGGSFSYIADGTNLEWGNAASQAVSYAGQTSFSTMGSTAFNTAVSSTGTFQSFYANGGAVSSTVVAAPVTGGNTITICSNAGNNFPANAQIGDILVYNAFLTLPQFMQLHAWSAAKYGQTTPWAALTAINVIFGDSINQGVNASNFAHQPAYLAAQTLGLSLGQWSNIAVGGITVANMDVLAPTWVDPLPAQLGKKINLVGFEWFNENNTNPTLPQPFNHSQTYLANRKLKTNLRTVWGTSTGYNGDPSTNRNSYNTAFDGASTTNIDSYMSIHTDAQIGTSAAFANHPANWSDGVHLSDTGYPFLATQFVNGINALP